MSDTDGFQLKRIVVSSDDVGLFPECLKIQTSAQKETQSGYWIGGKPRVNIPRRLAIIGGCGWI